MTIGPDPMIRILWISVRLGIPHQIKKLFEQVVRVVRTGRRFGMILNAESRYRTMFETFDSVVVQVDMRDRHIVQVQAVRIHSKTVILRRYFDLVAFQIHDWMIPAVMSELELVGLTTQ